MDKRSAKNYAPVIIIGAPRSGTNILRDVLTSIKGITTWPCDEINYIWRHGNVGYPSDELPADLVTPDIASYIQKSFDSLARKQKAAVVIEKTCANSLRVPFVDRAIPGARYIYIHRDGIEAAVPARLRWTAELDIAYILRKARYVPLLDLPYYAFRYLWSRVYRLFSREQRLAFWGPKLDDNQIILEQHDLLEVCAIQWQRCVEASEQAFADMPAGRVLEVRYEDFVQQPANEVRRILQFIDHDAADSDIAAAAKPVRTGSLGKARKSLSADELGKLETLIGSTLQRHGRN
jgi:hypothetical protein